MSITGGSVSVDHPAQHRAPSRIGLQGYTASTTRILRQLAADHRSIAMMCMVPILIITLMYFMFQNVADPAGRAVGVQHRVSGAAGRLPAVRDVRDHAITMQRERASGTLERILTTPLRRLDLLAAYGTAFSVAATAAGDARMHRGVLDARF